MILNSHRINEQFGLAKCYLGNVVMSDSDVVLAESVGIERLNDLVVKVSFHLSSEKFVFRAVVKEQDEGALMLIQKRVTKEYILNGQTGFLYNNKSVHGGYLTDLDSFYFHLKIQFFDGKYREVYFLGKDEQKERLSFVNHDFKLQA